MELQQFHLYFGAKPALKRFRRSLEAWRHFIHTGDQEDVGTNTCSSGEELLDLIVIQARRALRLAKVQPAVDHRESVDLDVRPKRIIEKYPQASSEKLLRIFEAEVIDNPTLNRVIRRQAFVAALEALSKPS